jgi:hypothetical protein
LARSTFALTMTKRDKAFRRFGLPMPHNISYLTRGDNYQTIDLENTGLSKFYLVNKRLKRSRSSNDGFSSRMRDEATLALGALGTSVDATGAKKNLLILKKKDLGNVILKTKELAPSLCLKAGDLRAESGRPVGSRTRTQALNFPWWLRAKKCRTYPVHKPGGCRFCFVHPRTIGAPLPPRMSPPEIRSAFQAHRVGLFHVN